MLRRNSRSIWKCLDGLVANQICAGSEFKTHFTENRYVIESTDGVTSDDVHR